MGEAPAFCYENPLKEFANGNTLKSKSAETAIVTGNKKYVIEGSDGKSTSLGVRIYDESTAQWVHPVVLGTKPRACKGHLAVLLNEDRILIIKKGASPDDCLWFLELDTQYVRDQKTMHGGNTEVVAWSKGVRGDAEMPIVISGPSGVGKGTLINKLMKEYPSMFGFSVSHTTRAPRVKEEDGVHYHFTEKSVMEKEIKDGKFLEYASVHGNLYGTSIEAVEVVADEGKRCILDIDVQGARSVRQSPVEAIFIFIRPPSMEELERRLRARGTETEAQISKRLRNAEAELEQGISSGLFDHILYNDELEDCYQRLKEVLGLDGNVGAAPNPVSRGFDLPVVHSASELDNQIIIDCGTQELEKASKNRIVLDVSRLRGGAPGHTRGLDLYAVNSFSDELKEVR